jgi:hypothetical protein
MFVETITAPREEWEHWNKRLRTLTEPPEALIVSIAWDAGDGNVSVVNLWDSPEAVGDFYVERVHSVVKSEGKPANTPRRHGEPIVVYIRK